MPLRPKIAGAIVFIVGLGDLLAGAALLLTPRWFFDTVAPFWHIQPSFQEGADRQ